MTKQSLLLICCIGVALFVVSNCKQSGKSLSFYRDNGNFVVSDNFLVKSSVPLASADVQQLIALDTAYAKLTQGKCQLLTVPAKLNALQTKQIRQLEQLTDRKYFDNWRYFVDITEGCYEKRDIDWSQFGDLKVKLDAILSKYKPATINGNISITNNQIATSVVELQDADIQALSRLSTKALDGYDICPPDGTGKVTRYIRRVGDITLKPELDFKIDQVLSRYDVGQLAR